MTFLYHSIPSRRFLLISLLLTLPLGVVACRSTPQPPPPPPIGQAPPVPTGAQPFFPVLDRFLSHFDGKAATPFTRKQVEDLLVGFQVTQSWKASDTPDRDFMTVMIPDVALGPTKFKCVVQPMVSRTTGTLVSVSFTLMLPDGTGVTATLDDLANLARQRFGNPTFRYDDADELDWIFPKGKMTLALDEDGAAGARPGTAVIVFELDPPEEGEVLPEEREQRDHD